MRPSLKAFLAVLWAVGVLAVCQTASAAEGTPRPMGAPHAVPANFLGANVENNYGEDFAWTDPVAADAIKAAGVQAVRFPGGDSGNYWDWRRGGFWPRYAPGPPPFKDTLASLAGLARATGAIPTYNLNVMTHDGAIVSPATLDAAIAYQLQMLETASGLGLPVRSLELGNEFFWGGADHQAAFPTGVDYALRANQWAQALRRQFPKAQIAAVGSIPDPSPGQSRTRSWNAEVFPLLKGVDAITLHRYDSIIDGGIYDPETAEQALSHVFTDWAKVTREEVTPITQHHWRIWVTEFGGLLDCTQAYRLSGTWVEGLYQAVMVLQFLSTADLTQIQLYNLDGSTSSVYFRTSSSYYNSCTGNNFRFTATPGALTASGEVYGLISHALRGPGVAWPVSLSAPIIKPQRPAGGWYVPPYPSAIAVALSGFKGAAGEREWLMINLAAQPLPLHYPGMGVGLIESLSAPTLTTSVPSPSALIHTTGPFDGAAFQLPPFSVNRIYTPAK